MSSKHPIKAYTRASHTVAKTRQVVMLYDGVIRFLKQAAEAIENGAIEERYLKLTRASDVITGLQGSLDFTAGGQTAEVLNEFYSSIDMRILTLHRKPSVEMCNTLISELKEMRDVWHRIDSGGSDEAAVPAENAATEEPVQPAPVSVKFSA
jgi:flagellar protein FliS